MTRSTLLSALIRPMAPVTLGLLLGACGQTVPDGAAPAGDDDLLATAANTKGKTLRDLGFSAAARGSAGTPNYLAGRIPAAVRSGDDLRSLFLGSLHQAYGLAAGTDFQVLSETRDAEGYRYFRLRQLHTGVPVNQAEVTVQVDEGGDVTAVLGELAPRVELRAALTSMDGDAAVRAALATLRSGGPEPRIHEAPTQQILRVNGAAVLAYRAVVEYLGKDGRALEELFVDAASGAVLQQNTRIHTALSRTIYDLKMACLSTGQELPGTLMFNEGGTSADQSAMGAYNNTGTTYHFYKHMFGRDSFDNMGAPLKSSVHAQFNAGFSCTGANAAWLGAPYNQMVYGDGDANTFKPLALSLDVSAHELTHAVTNYTSNLTYRNESGGLNEAMSDIFGAAAEAWSRSGGGAQGNPATITPTAATWQIGEDIAKPGLPGGALRFMNNPTADNYSKDYYPEKLPDNGSDNGGVHGNSGIANLAFYLVSVGGRHPRGKTNVDVTGVGITKAMQIFYKANTSLFNASTNFAGARNATAQAAKDLFGNCGAEYVAVQKAWDAVGVQGTWQCGGGGDTTAPTVSLTSPANGATLSGVANLSANAQDNVAVTTVEFYRGNALIGSKAAAPYTFAWDTKSVADGSYTLTAKAKDAAGNVGSSTSVTVTVKNGGGGGGGTINEKEPNDVRQNAQAVDVSGTTVVGTIASSADRDVYKVSIPAGKTLNAVLTPPSGSDFDIYIHNEAGSLLGFSDNPAGVVDTVNVKNGGAAAATYYLYVRYYSGASTTKTYSLKLTW